MAVNLGKNPISVIPAKAGIWIVITGMFLQINPDLGHTPRDEFAFEDYF